jgi:hypothetical protein
MSDRDDKPDNVVHKPIDVGTFFDRSPTPRRRWVLPLLVGLAYVAVAAFAAKADAETVRAMACAMCASMAAQMFGAALAARGAP